VTAHPANSREKATCWPPTVRHRCGTGATRYGSHSMSRYEKTVLKPSFS
jgi:hypothetical protein